MNLRIRLIVFTVLILLFSCSQPSDMESTGLLDTEFYSFDLFIADNSAFGLAYDVIGRQEDGKIILEYPNYSIPSYILTPRFSTDAVSVEVEGVQQTSAVSSVDFSTPVTYTLTSRSGQVQQFDVELALQLGWQDMGTNPVLAGVYPSLIKTGFLHELNPFVVCLDNASTLRAYALDMIDGSSWTEFAGGPGGVDTFDSHYWNGQIFSVYQTAGPGGNIELQTCVPPNVWSGVLTSNPYTGSAAGLHSFPGSPSYLFTAWIDDAGVSDIPVVWEYDGAAFNPKGSIIGDTYGAAVPLHAESFRAVFNGGAELYAAVTFKEGPGLIHLFKFNMSANTWTSIGFESGIPADESSRVIIDMFYDSHKQAPVVFTRSRDNAVENTYKITPRYYNELAGVWTNIDYIDPFYISEADYTSLSIGWFDNSPAAAFGNTVIDWDGEVWDRVGDDNYSSSPSVQAMFRGALDTYMTALRDDGTGDLIVRFFQ